MDTDSKCSCSPSRTLNLHLTPIPLCTSWVSTNWIQIVIPIVSTNQFIFHCKSLCVLLSEYSQSTGFPPPFQRPHGTLYQPVKPRNRRKRKLAETDIEDVNPFNEHKSAIPSLRNPTKKAKDDGESVCLQFMKQSNKRKRTNQMEHSKDQIHVDTSLERNIYTHDPHKPPQSQSARSSPKRGKEEMADEVENKRRETPYIHPYHLAASLSPQNRSKSPEDMMDALNLDGFRMKNSDNEGVSVWRQSIESQLMNARNHTPSQIQELCRRISDTSGLGRAVLVAKLRRQLPAEVFQRVCRMVEDGQRSQSVWDWIRLFGATNWHKSTESEEVHVGLEHAATHCQWSLTFNEILRLRIFISIFSILFVGERITVIHRWDSSLSDRALNYTLCSWLLHIRASFKCESRLLIHAIYGKIQSNGDGDSSQITNKNIWAGRI